MSSTSSFRPDWTSPPGDTIRDLLLERGISVEAFAQRLGTSNDDVDGLLTGAAPITIEMARRLEEVLGATVSFWMSRDYQYREDSSRVEDRWLAGLPLGDMARFGWIDLGADRSARLTACLRFFNVGSIAEWRLRYLALPALAAFRTSKTFTSQPGAVAAWLRKGELEAEAIECSGWDSQKFRDSLSDMRKLTKYKDPRRFLPTLQAACAESGVAVAVVRAPRGCRASGATRFLLTGKAMLLLSLRFLTDDQFWFTFFHEAGHLVLHGNRGLILEGESSGVNAEDEQEANSFAADTLVPRQYLTRLRRLGADAFDVIRFAIDVGVSPGVVVGQLQHLGRLRHNQLNRLKRHYSWVT